MERRKVQSYDDGYSHSDIVKRVTAVASALLLCGSLTACHRNGPDNQIMGDMVYEPPVSDSDISSDEGLTLDGEEQYFPVEGDIASRDYDGFMTVEPSDGD